MCHWLFNTENAQLEAGNQTQILTNAEKDLLKFLVSHAGQLVLKETLCEALGLDIFSRAIDVQITRLRKKIEVDARKPRHLQTVRGKGYILHIGHAL